MPGPTFIECERIDLAPAAEEDTEFLREGENHPDVRRYISAFRTPTSDTDDAEESSSGSDNPSLLAVPRDGEFAGEPVGTVALSPLIERDDSANLGIWFHPKAWGQGYALEACAYFLEYGFRELGLHRVSATVMAPNEASHRLCDRLGFTHEGTARESQFAEGGYVDAERYGLLVHEWTGTEDVLELGQ